MVWIIHIIISLILVSLIKRFWRRAFVNGAGPEWKTKYLNWETDLCTHILVHLFATRSHISETIESRFFYKSSKLYLAKRISNRESEYRFMGSKSVIIWGVRRRSATRIEWIFGSTTMPILKNFARAGSVHSSPFMHTLKLPLSFSCGWGK
jgi:hypothetical protein